MHNSADSKCKSLLVICTLCDFSSNWSSFRQPLTIQIRQDIVRPLQSRLLSYLRTATTGRKYINTIMIAVLNTIHHCFPFCVMYDTILSMMGLLALECQPYRCFSSVIKPSIRITGIEEYVYIIRQYKVLPFPHRFPNE
jgi:hypothetical protein